jgi:hypothetical protein
MNEEGLFTYSTKSVTVSVWASTPKVLSIDFLILVCAQLPQDEKSGVVLIDVKLINP